MFEKNFNYLGSSRLYLEGLAALDRINTSVYPKYMDTKQLNELERRKRILEFWSTHGLEATKDAFSISRRTLFRWQSNVLPKSRVHTNGYQKRHLDPVLVLEIQRLRATYPRLGKEKLTPLLNEFCKSRYLQTLSESTVGRILGQLKEEGKLPDPKKLRLNAKTGKLVEKQIKRLPKLRRNGYLPALPGDLLQVDGVLTFAEGLRRYTFTAVDLVSRFAVSHTYATASSRNGKDFLNRVLNEMPFSVSHIQTDNGSEFLKEFRDAAAEAELVHFYNWVKQPKYQGWIERFNRTIQEEFLDWRHASLALDLPGFNEQLKEWLVFYNTKRVHRGLGTPGHRLTPMQYLETTKECQRG